MKTVLKAIGIVLGLLVLFPLIKRLIETISTYGSHMLIVVGLVALAILLIISLAKD